jgi:hypothetical protein
MITILSLILGILGLVASLVGTYFTYISFVNPLYRLKKYLKKSNDWEKFIGIEDHLSIYRYKKYPNFQIVIDWDREIVDNFHEEWMNDSLYPDKTNNTSYCVRLEVNAMLLDKELFVSLDGHRYFVPVPKIANVKNNKREFYYDKKQIQLANIIGHYHFGDKNIYDFIKNQRKAIILKED